MLPLSQAITSKIANTYTFLHQGDLGMQPSTNGTQVNAIYIRLASLSQQKQWILYTANCPRPVYSELVSHHINCKHIVHLKPSSVLSEEEIVIKAIVAGTASAIVASNTFDLATKGRIKQLAAQHQCEVFFLDGISSHSDRHH